MITVSSFAETSDVGSDDQAAVCSSVLLCRLDPLWQDQQQQVLRNFLSGVCRSVEAETVTTCHPDRGLQICAKCDEGSSGLPIASTRPFDLVAKASTASKIDFRTPQACLPTSVDSTHETPGTPIDRDQPAEIFPPGLGCYSPSTVTRPGGLPLR
jgi:hypothetical protein